jgi:hypothetical protein
MRSKHSDWLNVDITGLRKLLARRGKQFVLYELIQNAWDANCSLVSISLSRPQGGKARLVVTDDSPEGFRDLTHAFTLFAESDKKGSAMKRGAFNAGDKFVLAFCEEASIISTTGGILFDKKGRRFTQKRRHQGSEFAGVLKLTVPEWEQIARAARRLIPPIETLFNGEVITERKPLHQFDCILPTVVADGAGSLCRRSRKTEVGVYEPLPGETPSLYEMGLPVVETGDKWHVDIQQRVPLNLERDNVNPSYLQAVRVAVLNEMADRLNANDTASTWVRQASGDERVQADAFDRVIGMRFGEKRVTYDPSDSEANLIATSKGYTVISSASLTSQEWENVRRFESSLPAGRVTPSPRPFSPAGTPLRLLADKDKDAAIIQFEGFSQRLGQELIGLPVAVAFADDSDWGFRGCYGDARLTVNVYALGREWFRGGAAELLEKWIPFLIHEFAHYRVRGHLSEDYHVECCRLAGVLARRMHETPTTFALCDVRTISP